MRSIRASLEGVAVAGSSLRDVAMRDRELAISFLDVQIAEAESLHFQRGNPSLALGEAVFGVVSLITRPFAPAAQRVRALAGRLDAIPRFLAGARQSIAGGVPDPWRAKCLHECEGATRLLRQGVAIWLEAESVGAPVTASRLRGGGRGRRRLSPLAHHRTCRRRQTIAMRSDRNSSAGS